MKKILLMILLACSQSVWTLEKINALLDGLHQDAHEGILKLTLIDILQMRSSRNR